VARPAQVSSGGWTTDKPVRIDKDTQTRQRELKAKMVKATHDMQYIKSPYCAQWGDYHHGNSNH